MSRLDQINERMTAPVQCRNPECRDGFTPGILTAGKGTPNAPVIGATMRWGWVKCRACNPVKDHPYSHVPRTNPEIAERARLADQKAPYDAQAAQKRAELERIRASTPAPTAQPTQQPASSAMVERLLAQIEKLTDQVTSLMVENRALRTYSAENANGTALAKQKLPSEVVEGGEVIERPTRKKRPRTLS